MVRKEKDDFIAAQGLAVANCLIGVLLNPNDSDLSGHDNALVIFKRQSWGKNPLISICYIGLLSAYANYAQSPTTGDQ